MTQSNTLRLPKFFISLNIRVAVVIACIGLCALGVGIWLQYFVHAGVFCLPCLFCILQRIFLPLITGLALLKIFSARPALPLSVGMTFLSLGGILTAAHQISLLGKPSMQCGKDPIERWLDQWLINEKTAWFFKPKAVCAEGETPFLGLAIPHWSILVFFVFLVLAFPYSRLFLLRRAATPALD